MRASGARGGAAALPSQPEVLAMAQHDVLRIAIIDPPE